MTQHNRILIAETDPELTAAASRALEEKHYEVMVIHNMRGPVDPVLGFHPDLMIIDSAFAGSDPHGYLQAFWEKTHNPVLVISSNPDVSNKVLWLEKGADDYLIKPFDMRELNARVLAILRRCMLHSSLANADIPVTLEYPELSINLSSYTVRYHGEKLSMPPKEIELLYFLAASPGQVFTRDQILHHIWGYEYAGDTRTVDVHIKRLRRKFPSPNTWSIETVWGVGYKFQIAHPDGG